MGLQLGRSAHMGHKYLHKHTVHPFTFVGTYRYSHTYRQQNIKAALASQNNRAAISERARRVICLTPISNPFIEERINQKIRHEQMETSVWGNEFLVESEKNLSYSCFFQETLGLE